VAGAAVVRVRLDVGKDTGIDVQVERWWTDPAGHQGSDLAVVVIPVAVTAGRTFEVARFGRISDSAAVLKVEVFGFRSSSSATNQVAQAEVACSGTSSR
jgi:hypothetical protein